MTKERVMDIFVQYLDNDLATAELGYVRDVVSSICTMDEIKELGIYEWLGFDEEVDE